MIPRINTQVKNQCWYALPIQAMDVHLYTISPMRHRRAQCSGICTKTLYRQRVRLQGLICSRSSGGHFMHSWRGSALVEDVVADCAHLEQGNSYSGCLGHRPFCFLCLAAQGAITCWYRFVLLSWPWYFIIMPAAICIIESKVLRVPIFSALITRPCIVKHSSSLELSFNYKSPLSFVLQV